MILFILQPYPSHYYPTFGLAHELMKNGEKVIFTTTPNLNKIIQNEGFENYEFQYLSEYIVRNSKVFFGLFLKNLTSKDYLLQRKNEFENAFNNVKELISKYKPSHVYIDQSLAEYFFYFKPYVPNITIVHTKIYSRKTNGIPPMNSIYVPKGNLFSQLKIDGLWLNHLLKQRLRELVLKIAFLGKDEIYFWKKHCKKNGMNWKKEIDLKHSLNRGVKNVENLVFAPKKLEFFAFKKPKNVQFYDKISIKNESSDLSKSYKELKRKYFIEKKFNIVYMAFGTLAQGPKVVDFFNNTISTIEKLPKTILIISRGNYPMNLLNPKNVFIFNYLPQQDVLLYTDLFITHGGLGSVKEAFYHEVPMLVAPINKFIDQNGNAARIKANGYGDRIDIDNYSMEELISKITTLLSNKNKNSILK
ncbi:UDP:flavonoid glycosyltransferase YjiC (YdhE family) [Saonia flava]|uniref:UDP:flavonoid glycosyltransferase YjiC (YdhE family) n=1 Tax=Saonia flava TaxID=523696 RepID=A0A846QQE2_9FLAO|nr:glycosyltransferase [Saonia flava]NJB70331.1 UDP:flavonoid glycosyltransferase YjiC (YdhE family) [Saonia flava]